MSVKLVEHKTKICSKYEDNGFCYCRRNPHHLIKNKKTIPLGEKIHFDLVDTLNKESPHELNVEFGPVPVNASDFKEISIISECSIKSVEEKKDGGAAEHFDHAFRLSKQAKNPNLPTLVSSGDKSGKFKFRIYFEPGLPAMNYIQTLHLVLINAKNEQIDLIATCHGESIGPSICLSENKINFSVLYYGEEKRDRVELSNISEVPAKFQFDIDNTRSVFKVCPTAGLIPPNTSLYVNIHFHPQKPKTYYKRIFCFILHQQPQILDLVGFCIPRPLLVPTFGIDFGLCLKETKLLPLLSDSNEEYFNASSQWGIRMSRDLIDFSYKDPLDKTVFNEAQKITVFSDLPYDVIIDWTPDPTQVFSVSPESAILPSFRSVKFDFRFTPTFPSTFYSGQLECFAHPVGHNWTPPHGSPWHFAQTQRELKEKDEKKGEENVDDWTSSREGTVPKTLSDSALLPTALQRFRNAVELVIQRSKSSIDLKSYEIDEVDTPQPQHHPSVVEAQALPPPPPPVEPVETKKAEGSVSKKGGKLKGKKNKKKKNSEATSEVSTIGKQSPPHQHQHSEKTEENLLNEEHEAEDKEIDKTKEGKHLLSLIIAWHQSEEENKIDEFRLYEERRGDLEPILNLDESEVEKIESERMIQSANVGEMPQHLAIPLSISIGLVGHTYKKGPPVSEFKCPSKIQMEASWPNSKTSRSFLLKNNSDLPISFDFSEVEQHGVYRIKPTKGVIPGNFHQIVLVLLTSTSSDPFIFIQNSTISLNNEHLQKISFYGLAELPRLDFSMITKCKNYTQSESKLRYKKLFFSNSVPEYFTEESFSISNPTRFYYKFDFTLHGSHHTHHHDENPIFQIFPNSGYLLPYQSQKFSAKFCPKVIRKYEAYWLINFIVYRVKNEPVGLNAPNFKWKLSCSGIGEQIKVQSIPEMIDFGLVEVFNRQTRFIHVLNNTNAEISINLSALHEEWLTEFHASLITLSPSFFYIKPHDSMEISITIRPNVLSLERFHIGFTLGEAHGGVFKCLAIVSFIGDHPQLKVIDISNVAKDPVCDSGLAWSLFSIDKLNKALKCGSSSYVKEGHFISPPLIDITLPPSPLGSPPSLFTLLLANRGALSGRWEVFETPKSLTFREIERLHAHHPHFNGEEPNDMDFLYTLWVRKALLEKKRNSCKNLEDAFYHDDSRVEVGTSSLTSDSVGGAGDGLKRQNSLLLRSAKNHSPFPNAELFKSLPSKGTLGARESMHLSFKYSHKKVGLHEAYFLLRVYPSVFIWIRLNGHTLEENKCFLYHFYPTGVKLAPIPLSDMDPPIQMVWIYNGGSRSGRFQVSPIPFKEAKKSNYGHDVFELISKTGVVEPGSWAQIKIRFSPIEFKDYSMILRILSLDEDREIFINISGTALLNPPSLESTGELSGLFKEVKSVLIDPFLPISVTPSQVTFKKIIPTGQSATSIIIIRNLSSKSSISFKWPETPIDGGGKIIFRPQHGIIPPDEKVTCMLTLNAGRVALSFTSLLRCFFKDENPQSGQFWTNKVANALAHAHNDPLAAGDAPNLEDLENVSSSKLLPVTAYISSSFGALNYTKISEQIKRPPISACKTRYEKLSCFPLPPFASELSKEVLSALIWDIFHSETFEDWVKNKLGHEGPNFSDYVESQLVEKKIGKHYKNMSRDLTQAQTSVEFSIHEAHEVLQELLFDLFKKQ